MCVYLLLLQKVFNRRSLQFKLILLVLRWGALVSLRSRVRPRYLIVDEVRIFVPYIDTSGQGERRSANVVCIDFD